MRYVLVRHSCGANCTFNAPTREIQLAICTAYLARDPVARVRYDLESGQGWEAKLTFPEAAIVIDGGPMRAEQYLIELQSDRSTRDVVRAARTRTTDLKDLAIAELAAMLGAVAGHASPDTADLAIAAREAALAFLLDTAPTESVGQSGAQR